MPGRKSKPAPRVAVCLMLGTAFAWATACGGGTGGDSDKTGSTPDGAVPSGLDGGPLSEGGPLGPVLDGGDAGSHEGDAAPNDDAGDGGTPGESALGLLPFVDGPVRALAHAGNAWYLGGDFLRLSHHRTQRMVLLSPAGRLVATCPLDSAFDGQVSAIVHAGTSLYVGGAFRTYKGVTANRIAKLDAVTCALDTLWSPAAANGFDNDVHALHATATHLFVGGAFTAYRGVVGSAGRIAKLDLATGALDATFGSSMTGVRGFDRDVYALASTGTTLFAGGLFTKYEGVTDSANHIAKLDATTGDIDVSFSPPGPTANGFDGSVHALLVVGNRLYAGGSFVSYRGVPFSAVNVAKLNFAGTGSAYLGGTNGLGNNGTNGTVYALAASGTDLYLGGAFTGYRGGVGLQGIAKIDLLTGFLASNFHTTAPEGFQGVVRALVATSTSVYAGGNFIAYRGVDRAANGVTKLDALSGAVDATFLEADSSFPGVEGTVRALSFDGTTLAVGGDFGSYGGHRVNGLAKLHDVTFELDETFSPAVNAGFDGPVNALAVAGTSLYVGGAFNAYRGVADSAHRLAKLDLTSGVLDTGFGPAGTYTNGVDAPVRALAVAGTSLYLGGDFTWYRGLPESARRIAKVDLTTGVPDRTFSPWTDPAPPQANGFDAEVRALAVAGGSLYVGGAFTSYRHGNVNASRLAKLDLTTGAADETFSIPGTNLNGFDAPVSTLVTSGTALYVGGEFTAYKGLPNTARRLAKLDLTSGTIDLAFCPAGATANGFDGEVASLAILGGALYAGGDFTAYRGGLGSATRIAKIDLATAAVDLAFCPAAPATNGFDGRVATLLPWSDIVLVGGAFEVHRGTPAFHVARLRTSNGTAR